MSFLGELWLPTLALGVGLVLRRWSALALPARLERPLSGWPLPAICGAVSAACTWIIFGGLHPVPFIHDEASYLLEAGMLARGHFAMPAPPLPEFFEQFHVFTTPVLASRYMPGWPLALVPGIWIGLPVLVPVLLTGATAALLVMLVRRATNAMTALAAWAFWIVPPIEGRFRGTFLSEHLTSFLWLLAWWALWEWRTDRRTRWLAVVSVACAWQGITRPLTAIAFALPIAVVVLHDVIRERRWRALGQALVPGLALCMLVPLQDHAVTGAWSKLPMQEYSLRYAPWDLPGFGFDTTPPREALTADQAQYLQGFGPGHVEHTVANLPRTAATRVIDLFSQSGVPWGALGFTLLALIGLVRGPWVIRFAALTLLAHLVAYLWFAHPPHWLIYYLEPHAVLAALAAIGLAELLDLPILRPHPEAAHGPHVPVATAVMTVAILATVPNGIAVARRYRASISAPNRVAREITERLPAPAILFIRYAPNHHLDRAFVENSVDLAHAPVWRVHDLGAHNADLLRLAPDRHPFGYDEASGTVVALASDGVTPLPGKGFFVTPAAPRTD